MKRLIEVCWLTILGLALFTGLAAGEVKLVKGQTFYVPAYTSFMSGSHAGSLKHKRTEIAGDGLRINDTDIQTGEILRGGLG